MAIEQRGSEWGYRFTVRGREYRKSTGLDATASNRKDADAIEARAKLEALAGSAADPMGTSSFESAAADFVDWCFSTEYRSKPNSARRIQTSFQSLRAFFAERPVSEVDQNGIEDYKRWRIEKHGVRDVTLRHDLHALSVFFRKYAIRKRLATSNPVDLVTKPSDKDAVRINPISREDESRYFAHARGTLYDVARLILLQGCRPEEILSLRTEHVDLDAEYMHIAGGKSRAAVRDLPLTPESVQILRRRLEAAGNLRKRVEAAKGKHWLFPSERLEGHHITKLNAQHDRACQEAGVSFVLYDLRHTFATRMLTEDGVDVATVAALMGHSTPSIVLKHYAHPTEGAKKAAMKKYSTGKRAALRRVI